MLFLDVGANVEVRAQHLVQFAFLGAAFSEAVLGVERPRVGLLSVGEEAGKGTRGGRRGARGPRRRASGIDFAGNVEGRDLPAGAADVVVTDGFTGNVALKLMEGTASAVAGAIRDAAALEPARRARRPADAPGARRPAPRARPRRDRRRDPARPARRSPSSATAAPGAEGIANAIRLAARCVEVDAVERTAALLERGRRRPRRARLRPTPDDA